MVEYHRLVVAQCDVRIDGIACWDEMVIQLENNEGRAQAIQFLEDKMGWKFEGLKAVCPFCSDGILREDVEEKLEEESKLKLVKDEG